MTELNFIHKFIPGQGNKQGESTLLLLHGTGGTEKDLLPLADILSPQSNILSPRGKILENGMPRFFRRHAEGVFDVADLKYRTAELARFIELSSQTYNFDLNKIIAVGYSNGANMAASLLLLNPRLLRGAMLFRPMVPLDPDILPNLSEVTVFMSAGRNDNVIPRDQPEKLARLLENSGARVTLYWEDAGHMITDKELQVARQWLGENFL